MKCSYCGYEIPEGMLYCKMCGKEVCIVPDYNPLEDVLEAQVKDAISGEDNAEDDYLYDSYHVTARTDRRRRSSSSRNTVAKRNTAASRNTVASRNTAVSRNTVASRNTAMSNTMAQRHTVSRATSDRERRRRQAERKKALKRRKRRRVLFVLTLFIAALIAAGVLLYQTSYAGIVNKGYKAIETKEYDRAEEYFQEAITKDGERPRAYTGMSELYIAMEDLNKAEEVFLTAIERQSGNTELYRACIQFYIDTDQKAEIPILLEDAPDSVTEKLSEYMIEIPEFSLDDTKIYDDVQELTLSAKQNFDIYYTTDDQEPSVGSTKYSAPIQIGEGQTVIRAIAVNEDGIPSLSVKRSYTVELPMEDAPAVSPSTGQYEQATQIEIKVPEGYEAFYTMDRSEPTTSSEKYTGPIEMPAGETIFKAILVNGKGRVSGVTTRNYVLELKE